MNKRNEKTICFVHFILSVGATFIFFYILLNFSYLVLWIDIPTPITSGFAIAVSFGVFGLLLAKARRRRQLRLKAVALGGLSSTSLTLLLLTLLLIRTDKKLDQPPNRQQHLISPSGKYILTVPVKRIKQKLLSFGHPYRVVTISDPNGKIIYQDKEETFPAWFGTYWVWDNQDRAWLFGSDAGIFFYESIDGNWIKSPWYRELGISPPESLYPDYVEKSRPKNTRSNRDVYIMNISNENTQYLFCANPLTQEIELNS
jgi:hypothetical protein